MKKVFKIGGIALGGIVLLLLIGAAAIHFSGIPTYVNEAPELKIMGDSAMVAEGKRISTMMCAKCHQAENGKLEGHFMADMPEMFGKVWSANITQHPEYGTGRYTDGELAYLLRTGIKKDGGYAPPWMPKFPNMSDRDIESIIAYLRSDAPELAASDKAQPASQPSFFAKFLCRVAFKPLPYPAQPILAPPAEDKVAFGKYIATAKVDCYACHSPSFQNTDVMVPENTPGYFSGGNAMPNLEGEIIYTRNLTPDKETGIGKWTEEQFVQAVRFGKRPNGTSVRYPMSPHPELTDEEVAAIFAYLQTIPAIHQDVDVLYQTEKAGM